MCSRTLLPPCMHFWNLPHRSLYLLAHSLPATTSLRLPNFRQLIASSSPVPDGPTYFSHSNLSLYPPNTIPPNPFTTPTQNCTSTRSTNNDTSDISSRITILPQTTHLISSTENPHHPEQLPQNSLTFFSTKIRDHNRLKHVFVTWMHSSSTPPDSLPTLTSQNTAADFRNTFLLCQSATPSLPSSTMSPSWVRTLRLPFASYSSL